MPWFDPIAATGANALVGLPNASMVLTTRVDGLGAVESGATRATSLHPAGKLPTASPSKVSGVPTGPATASPPRHATSKARTAQERCTDMFNRIWSPSSLLGE